MTDRPTDRPKVLAIAGAVASAIAGAQVQAVADDIEVRRMMAAEAWERMVITHGQPPKPEGMSDEQHVDAVKFSRHCWTSGYAAALSYASQVAGMVWSAKPSIVPSN